MKRFQRSKSGIALQKLTKGVPLEFQEVREKNYAKRSDHRWREKKWDCLNNRNY